MAIGNLLNQTIVLYPAGETRDRYGNKSFGSPVGVRGRFERSNRTIKTATREDEPTEGRVFLEGNATIARGDKLSYDGLDYRAMRVDPITGRNGTTDHYEVIVQFWSYA